MECCQHAWIFHVEFVMCVDAYAFEWDVRWNATNTYTRIFHVGSVILYIRFVLNLSPMWVDTYGI